MELAYDIHRPCFLLQRFIDMFCLKRDFTAEVNV
jgi:hypothetical protein